MSESPKPEVSRFTRREYANLGLTIAVALLAYLWFGFHLKRQIGGWTFGGVTTLAALAFAGALWKMFAGDELKNAPRQWLSWRHTRWATVVALVLVVTAHLVTGSLHVDAEHPLKEGERFSLTFKRGGEVVKNVTLNAKSQQASLTFPLFLEPVQLDVETTSPRGYEPYRVDLGRFVTKIEVPDATHKKKYNVIRLASGTFLTSLQQDGPDENYKLSVLVNGKRVGRLEALGFQTIYIGGAADELRDALREVHGNERHRADLVRFVRSADANVPDAVVNTMMVNWLADPVYLDTPELKPTDDVRVVLTGYGTTPFDQPVRPADSTAVTTTFLKGVLPQ